MANKIQIKRGAFLGLPTLLEGEFGFSTDQKRVHIGDGIKNYEAPLADITVDEGFSTIAAPGDKPIWRPIAYTDLSFLDNDTALTADSAEKIATQHATKTYVDGIISAANAMVYKGTLDCSLNPNYPAADAGDVYIVSVAGLIGGASGISVEVGDLIVCEIDGTVSGDQVTVGANWNIIQKNIIGAVTGPASSVSGDFALFDGITGKILQDLGLSFSTDATLVGNSDVLISSQKAIKTYIDSADAGKLSYDQTLALTGDIVGGPTALNTGTIATTLASVMTAGIYNNVATQVRPFTVDDKGRITEVGIAIDINVDGGLF